MHEQLSDLIDEARAQQVSLVRAEAKVYRTLVDYVRQLAVPLKCEVRENQAERGVVVERGGVLVRIYYPDEHGQLHVSIQESSDLGGVRFSSQDLYPRGLKGCVENHFGGES